MRIVSLEKKNILLMQEKLQQAQQLLSDVYHYACDNGFDSVESQMSCADSCIIESIDYLEIQEAQLIDDLSWRA
jgi:hypothetical protein